MIIHKRIIKKSFLILLSILIIISSILFYYVATYDKNETILRNEKSTEQIKTEIIKRWDLARTELTKLQEKQKNRFTEVFENPKFENSTIEQKKQYVFTDIDSGITYGGESIIDIAKLIQINKPVIQKILHFSLCFCGILIGIVINILWTTRSDQFQYIISFEKLRPIIITPIIFMSIFPIVDDMLTISRIFFLGLQSGFLWRSFVFPIEKQS